MEIPADAFAKESVFKKKPDFSSNLEEISNIIKDLSRRLRILEERSSNLRHTQQITEQNMIQDYKKLAGDIKAIDSDLTEIKRELSGFREETKLIVKELSESAKKEDVKVLEKYIALWEPLNFVTQREVEKMIARKLEEALKNRQNEELPASSAGRTIQ